MPHASIKMLAGRSEESKKAVAAAVAKAIEDTLPEPKKYVSVTLEEFTPDEWVHVYNSDIGGKPDKLGVTPGYTDPVTFN